MKAIDFINKQLKSGEHIHLVMASGFETDCVFGGYKMFDGIDDNLDYSLYPVFYRIAKNGGVQKRSVFGDTHLTWTSFREIASCENISAQEKAELERYTGPLAILDLTLVGGRHVKGYFSEKNDISGVTCGYTHCFIRHSGGDDSIPATLEQEPFTVNRFGTFYTKETAESLFGAGSRAVSHLNIFDWNFGS